MSDNKKVVGICSIGSGVGQSIISSCNTAGLKIITLGLGNNPLAYGQYECDDYAYIPSYYNDDYLESLLAVCTEKNVKLLIPGHDDEAQVLAGNSSKLKKNGIEVLTSNVELINICRSKDKLAQYFSAAGDIFVKSYTKNEIISDIKKRKKIEFPLIAKPKDGYASKDIYIVQSENDIGKLSDELIYQEIAIPEKSDPSCGTYLKNLKNGINTQIGELSIQLVADKNGAIHGCFTTYNKLNNGIPIEVIPYESPKLENAMQRLIPLLQEKGLKGPINIQGRMTDNGLKVFEINPRFTGISGLRAKFGFNEVSACIKHWLFTEPMQDLNYNSKLVGIRQTADKVVSSVCNQEIQELQKKLPKAEDKKHNILITGSTGALGSTVVKLISNHKNYRIYTLDRSQEKSIKIHGKIIEKALSWDDIENSNFDLGIIDTLWHFASARPFHNAQEIADSTNKTIEIFNRSVRNNIQQIIYASSQSIYGKANAAPLTEEMSPSPENLYSLSKYIGETTLKHLYNANKSFKYIAIRLATLIGADPVFFEKEAIFRMTKSCIDNEVINIEDGTQKLNRLHVNDAANAIFCILEEKIDRNTVYNVSPESNLSIQEISEKIAKLSSKLNKKNPKIITSTNKDRGNNIQDTTMSSEKFRTRYQWSCDLNEEKTIEEIFRTLSRKQC